MYCEDIYGENGQEEWQCIDETLENEMLGFMTENEKNQYKHITENVLDEATHQKVRGVLEDFSSRVLEEKVSYDTKK